MKTKIYKIISIVLAIAIVFSVCIQSFTAFAAESPTYYVAYDGDDGNDGSNATNAFATIGGAIAYAKNQNTYGAGDIVNLKIVTNSFNDVLWGTPGEDGYVRFPEHDFKVNVSATGTITDIGNQNVVFGGPMYFENVYFKTGENVAKNVAFNGNDIEFGNKVNANAYYRFTAGGGDIASEHAFADDINVNFKNVANSEFKFYLSSVKNATTFDGDINVTFDSPNSQSNIYLGTIDGGDTTYNGNVNLNVKSSSTVFKIKRNNTARGITFAEGKALQVINSSGQNIEYSKIDDDVIAGAGKYFFITNNSGHKEALQFTDTAGKFAVDTEIYTVNAYLLDASGNRTGEAIPVQDGYLILTASGKYTVDVETMALTQTYYVSSTVETPGDGLTEGTAVKTVGDAVAKAVASNYDKNDVVTVKVMGTTAEIGVIPKYDFALNIQSNSANEKPVLTFKAGTYSEGVYNLANGGDTTYRNVVIKLDESWRYALLNWSNVVFEEDVVFDFHMYAGIAYGVNSLTDTSTIGGQKVVFKSNIPPYIKFSNVSYSDIVFHEDVTLVLEGDGKPEVSANTIDSSGKPSKNTTYNKNLNILDNQAYAVLLTDLEDATFKGKLQVINGAGTDYVANLRHVTNAQKIIINNKTGNKQVLDFTETAGKYVVNGDNTLYAFKDGVQVAKSEGGYIDVSAFGDGEYDVVASREKTYNATSTVAAAVQQAIDDGYAALDIITVNVDGETIDLGNLPQYAFDLVVKSDDKTTVIVNDTTLLANGGKATYKNVEIKYTGSQPLYLADQDAKFEKDVVLNIGGKLYIGKNADDVNGQNVEFLSFVDDIVLSNGANKTYTGNLNVILNSDDNTTVYFGDVAGTTYQKNVNLYVEKAQSIDFVNNATFSGALQIINSSDNNITGISGVESYIITDKTGIYKAIECTDVAGKYKLNFDTSLYNVTVKKNNSTVVENAVSGKYITLSETGEYTVTAELKGDYESYIYERISNNGNVSLQNFAAKVNAGEEVNVVYYGGSVTNGSGATEREATSWRALVGKWLVENFPNAKINNINRAIGATGSFLGSYRVENDVIAEKPDLFIIEFSINDWLGKFSYEDARRQFETIVRKTRMALPECDIITVFTTDKGLVSLSQTKADGTPGEIHEQAKAHEEIAIKYGIPSIHIGRALLDTLPNNFSQNQWNYYFMDSVHPLDAGYVVYANVIKEFLADCLFTQPKEVKEHILPEMVSETLLDGNIEFIAVDEDFVSNLEEGSGNYKVKYIRMFENIKPVIRVTEDTGVLKFKFTGTELSVREFNASPAGKKFVYDVKIDGGETFQVQFTNTPEYPILLAQDLPYGEHTVEISRADNSAGSYSEIRNFFARDQRAETVRTHKFENYISDNNATCQKNCTETAECEYGCGETYTRDIPDTMLAHKFENYISDNNATCQKNCTETAECEYGCGETDPRDIPDSIVDCKFETYVPNGDATCQKNETETAECKYGCGETDTRDIPDSTVDHKYTDATDTSCDFECGYIRQLGAQLIEEDGVKYYYYDGVKSTATDIVEYNDSQIYINKGRFLGKTGIVTVDGKKVYVRNGYFLGATGIVTIDGKKMYIRNGYFLGASGIVTIGGKKMYIRNGYFLGASGIVTVGGKKMYIRNGYFLGATGIVTVDGKKLYIRNGYFLGASGTVKVNGKTYKVVKGIVK